MTKIIEDTASLEWIAVKEYCETRIAEMREQNDDYLDLSDTAHLRGMIEFAKEVMTLGENTPKVEVIDETYLP